MKPLLPILAVFALFTGCALPSHIIKISGSEKPDLISLKAFAEISDADDFKAKASITVKRPDLIRVEVFGPMNRIIAVMAGDGKNCSFYFNGKTHVCNPEQGAGQGTPVSFFKSLTTGELVGIFMGKKEALDDKEGWTIETDRDGRILSAVKNNGAVSSVKIEVTGYAAQGYPAIPTDFIIEGGNGKFSIEYYSIELNPEAEPDNFTLPL